MLSFSSWQFLVSFHFHSSSPIVAATATMVTSSAYPTTHVFTPSFSGSYNSLCTWLRIIFSCSLLIKNNNLAKIIFFNFFFYFFFFFFKICKMKSNILKVHRFKNTHEFLLSQRISFVTVKIFKSKILINFDVFEVRESE